MKNILPWREALLIRENFLPKEQMQCSSTKHLYEIEAVNLIQIFDQMCERCYENPAEYRLKMVYNTRDIRKRHRLRPTRMEVTCDHSMPLIIHNSCPSKHHHTFLCYDCVMDEYCMAEHSGRRKCMNILKDEKRINNTRGKLVKLDYIGKETTGKPSNTL